MLLLSWCIGRYNQIDFSLRTLISSQGRWGIRVRALSNLSVRSYQGNLWVILHCMGWLRLKNSSLWSLIRIIFIIISSFLMGRKHILRIQWCIRIIMYLHQQEQGLIRRPKLDLKNLQESTKPALRYSKTAKCWVTNTPLPAMKWKQLSTQMKNSKPLTPTLNKIINKTPSWEDPPPPEISYSKTQENGSWTPNLKPAPRWN